MNCPKCGNTKAECIIGNFWMCDQCDHEKQVAKWHGVGVAASSIPTHVTDSKGRRALVFAKNQSLTRSAIDTSLLGIGALLIDMQKDASLAETSLLMQFTSNEKVRVIEVTCWTIYRKFPYQDLLRVYTSPADHIKIDGDTIHYCGTMMPGVKIAASHDVRHGCFRLVIGDRARRVDRPDSDRK